MSETPDIVYGRLLESAHISGYGFERMTDEFEWLLEEDRWQEVTPGFDDIDALLDTVDLSAFDLTKKKRLAKKLTDLQARQKATARALGVSEGAVSEWKTGNQKKKREQEQFTREPEILDQADDQQQSPEATGLEFTDESQSPTAFQRSSEEVAKGTRAATARQLKDGEREQKREQNQALVQETKPLEVDPDARYPTLVIDPPWSWDDEGDHEQLGRARPTYETMSLEEIKAMPIDRQVEDNAHIYLWITNRSLHKGFALLDAWGFRYITALTWCKPHFGMGNYFRGQTEHILFGVRGSLPLLRRDRGTWFMADRNGQHSGKPAEFYQLVEECSPGPWLEVFGRGERPGWTKWGAEAP